VISPGPLVASGRTSEVYTYGAGSVVKVPRVGVPGHWAALEADFTRSIHLMGAPAPSVGGIVLVEGREAIVFEHIVGPSMWEEMHRDPKGAATLAGELVALHREILRAGLPAGVPDLIGRMCTKIVEVEQLDADNHKAACEVANHLPRGAALLHGDLHPRNVLMSSRGPIAIDWFDAAIGNPVADVVRSSILMRPALDGVDLPHLPGATVALLSELHRHYVGGFAELLNYQRAELAKWEAVVGLSRVSEHAQHDESALVALWDHRNNDRPSSVLAASIASAIDQRT